MKLLILASLVAACTAGAGFQQNYLPPQYRTAPTYYPESVRPRAAYERNAAILRSVNDANEYGYRFAYETENGIQAEESGQEANGIQAQGSYSYTGDDGQVYSVRYTAGANGFQAEGAHLPTPPPLPEAIAKALQENARDEANGIYDDGSYRDGKYDSGTVIAARAYQPPRQYLAPGFRQGYRY
ncbi:cuticle protein 3-like [Plodia interpunctella]|uniref:cuticle protein 3-like n=1 Tax=Plodia interpunctella TaxID=58824 RepID=UPI002367F352|nr:cuticle protein 3-like [Plodia interpunctella]